ncbi:hypothetical protein ALTERO38_50700 [Alteromonas sp. 38]|nr:hypothetical protein ALTERO38_50700 [Alteromonas sp. 38]
MFSWHLAVSKLCLMCVTRSYHSGIEFTLDTDIPVLKKMELARSVKQKVYNTLH